MTQHCPNPAEPLVVTCGFLLIPAFFLLPVPVLLRRQSGSLPEATRKGALVGETATKRDLPETQVPLGAEKSLRREYATLD